MHLETIIKDLRERFARVEVRVSPPLVAFRESVYIAEEAPEAQHKPAKVIHPDPAPYRFSVYHPLRPSL